jgi:hypothetical protein
MMGSKYLSEIMDDLICGKSRTMAAVRQQALLVNVTNILSRQPARWSC